MLKRIALITFVGIFMTTQAIAGVTDEIKKTVDDVVRIVSDKEMKNNESGRRQALKEAIGDIFDYREMAKRSLGRHWKRRTPQERKYFVELFATLLENSYADKLESYHNEKIEYLRERVDGGYAEVRSRVHTANHDEFSLDYRLMKKKGKWMVYDVVIEGVSLVSNYRSQFNRIIRSDGYAELVRKLETKREELKAP
ncbi:MAG: ABC transporter substrate-binding protein [Pelobacteraceae bacterium]